jgi:hypothetical protein
MNQKYESKLEKIQKKMKKRICELNDIKFDEFYDSSGFSINEDPDGTTFIRLSDLNWEDSSKVYDTNSNIFIKRFLTAYYLVLLEFFPVMVEDKVVVRRCSRVKTADKFYKDIKKLDGLLLEGDNYGKLMIDNFTDWIFSKKNKEKPNRAIRYANDMYTELVNGTGLPTSQCGIPDDIALDLLRKFTYLIITGSTDFSNLMSFKKIEGCTRDDDLSKIIKDLGKQIKKRRSYFKRSILFAAYDYASPRIEINHIEKSDYTIIGIRAISFAAFFINNKRVTEFVDSVIG